MAIWCPAAPELYFARFNLIQKCMLSPSTARKCLTVFCWLWSVHTSIPEQIMQARKNTQHPRLGHPLHQNTWSKNRGRDSFPDKNSSSTENKSSFFSVEFVSDLTAWLQTWTHDSKCAWTSIDYVKSRIIFSHLCVRFMIQAYIIILVIRGVSSLLELFFSQVLSTHFVLTVSLL